MKKKELNIKRMSKKWNVKFSDCIVFIYKIRTEDIPFSIVANLKCAHCGGYKRKMSCLPYAMPYYKWRERVRKYKYAYVLIGQADGTVMIYDKGDPRRKEWKPRPDYFGHALIGVNMSMQTYMHNKILEIKKNLRKKGKKCLPFIAGPCHRCRECNIEGKCIHGINNISLEGAGMNVYGLLKKLKVRYEHPVKNFLTMVGAIIK